MGPWLMTIEAMRQQRNSYNLLNLYQVWGRGIVGVSEAGLMQLFNAGSRLGLSGSSTTRCEYIRVRSTAASLRPSVANDPDSPSLMGRAFRTAGQLPRVLEPHVTAGWSSRVIESLDSQ